MVGKKDADSVGVGMMGEESEGEHTGGGKPGGVGGGCVLRSPNLRFSQLVSYLLIPYIFPYIIFLFSKLRFSIINREECNYFRERSMKNYFTNKLA